MNFFKKKPLVMETVPAKQKTPAPEKDVPLYQIGVAENNRILFRIGHAELSMNKEGLNNLITQLTVFRDCMEVKSTEENQEDADERPN